MDSNILTFLQHTNNLKYLNFLNKIKNDIYTPLAEFDAGILKSKEPVPFGKISGLSFQPVRKGEIWGNIFDCAWFEFDCNVNFIEFENKVILIDVGAEGCIYKDGKAVQGITNVLGIVDNFQTAKGKQVIPMNRLFSEGTEHLHFYADCGYNGKSGNRPGKAIFRYAEICDFREDIFNLYYDVLACYQLIYALTDKNKKKEIKAIINKAVSFYTDNSVKTVKKTRESLLPLMDCKFKDNFTVYGVGHGHLDSAWLWPIRETKRKAVRTLSNAIYQGERCPGYVFNASQPQHYLWIKETEPELFKKIQAAVKDGVIEPQGGMWVEPDTNLPCGESLIRQCFYGKKFFKEEFSKDIKTLWLPDVFGYSAVLPQIIKKCGMENFMTIKLSWNNINSFPYHTFIWKGLDDSEVLVHMPPEGDYNSNANPAAVKKALTAYKEKDVSKIALMPYGIGDGGAGPGEYHIEMLKRCERLRYLPKAKMSSSDEFFEDLQKDKDNYPVYKGELYLEKHQGTYTTQGFIKKNNRKCEALLHLAEWLSSVTYLKGKEYPRNQLDEIWKEVLLYQFHDILPGSSIHRVYDECKGRYEIIFKNLNNIINDNLNFLKSDDNELKAVNQTDFCRSGYIKHNGSWFYYNLMPYSISSVKPVKSESENLNYGNDFIENQKLKVVFNEKGRITKIYDKENNYNCVASVFNAVRIYRDKFVHPYNAWDIDINYTKKKPEDMLLVSKSIYVDGRQIIWENNYKYSESTLTQKIILKDDCPFIEIKNKAYWNEKHKMLRIDFYPENYGDKVLCDIQFGNISRSTKTDNSIDYAQFEIPAHKWVDVYDKGYGVAILNDCKYGHRVKDGIISLNCLRSTVYPDETADRGEHNFTYAIYPHKQKPTESELIKTGYELNNPLLIAENISDVKGIAHCSDKNIISETVLINQHGNLSLRIYENSGTETDTEINISVPFKSIFETDMLFEKRTEISNTKLHFKPFEIKTLEVVL